MRGYIEALGRCCVLVDWFSGFLGFRVGFGGLPTRASQGLRLRGSGWGLLRNRELSG